MAEQVSLAQAREVLPPEVPRRLDYLRQGLRKWLLVVACGRLVPAVVLVIMADLCLDRLFRFDLSQRVVLLILGIAALVWAIRRWFVRPLSQNINDEELSRRIERRHPGLQQRLLSAVQFAQRRDHKQYGYSAAMVEATIGDAARALESVDLESVLDADGPRRAWKHMGIAALALAVLIAVAPATMGMWFQRNILLQAVAWPQDTHLQIQGLVGGRLIMPHGDDLQVLVRAQGVIPDLVEIDWRSDGDGGSDQLVKIGDEDFRWQLASVQHPLQFRITGGDDVTEWIDVVLMPRPVVDEWRLRYEAPAYTGAGIKELTAGESAYYLLAGGTLHVEGTCSKALEQVAWRHGERRQIVDFSGKTFAFALRGADVLDGTYRLDLVDSDGLAAKPAPRFTIKVVPDRQPTLQVRLDGIGDMVTPEARVPVVSTVQDDFGIDKAAVVYQPPSEGESLPPQHFAIETGLPIRGSESVDLSYVIEVSELGLEPGSHLSFNVEATDNDSESGPKTGRSSTFSLQVVTPEELRNELLRREQEQRQEFERLLERQMQLELQVVELFRTKEVDAAWRRKCQAIEKKQRLTGTRCKGIADQFARILAEVENNKLEEAGGTVRKRLEGGIINPLRSLGVGATLVAADGLDDLGNTTIDAAQRAALFKAVAKAQADCINEMKAILGRMVKWEGYQEAVTLLREILKNQKEVNEKTLKEQQKKILDLFEE